MLSGYIFLCHCWEVLKHCEDADLVIIFEMGILFFVPYIIAKRPYKVLSFMDCIESLIVLLNKLVFELCQFNWMESITNACILNMHSTCMLKVHT